MVFTVSGVFATIEAVHLQGVAALSIEEVDDVSVAPSTCTLQVVADREHVLVIGCAFASAEVEHSLEGLFLEVNCCFF